MVKIPLEAIPNQQVSVTLDSKKCVIHIYQRGDYLYMDLTVDGELLRQGAICLTDQQATGYTLVGLDGYLLFCDILSKGGTPCWDELGSRYILLYISKDEV